MEPAGSHPYSLSRHPHGCAAHFYHPLQHLCNSSHPNQQPSQGTSCNIKAAQLGFEIRHCCAGCAYGAVPSQQWDAAFPLFVSWGTAFPFLALSLHTQHTAQRGLLLSSHSLWIFIYHLLSPGGFVLFLNSICNKYPLLKKELRCTLRTPKKKSLTSIKPTHISAFISRQLAHLPQTHQKTIL